METNANSSSPAPPRGPKANQQSEPEKHQNMGPVIGTAGAIGIALYKFKFALLTALKGLSLVKLGWILKGSSSMLLSLGLYSMMFGWRYAATLIALIYIHELGHYFWMRVKGLEPNAPVFVPLLGAYTAMKKMPGDPVVHAEVAYAGPLIGGAAAIVLYFLAQDIQNIYLLAAANTGLILNLLQLIPMRPFDGGFIAACISKKLAIAGVIMTLLLGLSLHSILLLILGAVGFYILVIRKPANAPTSMGREGTTSDEPDKPSAIISGGTPISANPVTPRSAAILDAASHTVSLFDRLRISVAYFGLAAALGWYYWLSETQLVHLIGKR